MKNPATTRDICGTTRGYRKHCKMGELKCQPCRSAKTLHDNELRGTRPALKTDELVAEIEWMLQLNQGSGYILQAIGYAGKEATLDTRLQRNGHKDLSRRLLMMDRAAA